MVVLSRLSASTVTSATRDAATLVLEHDVGPEAVELAEKSGEAAGNVTKATGDVFLVSNRHIMVLARA
jgi:hypothetical protein